MEKCFGWVSGCCCCYYYLRAKLSVATIGVGECSGCLMRIVVDGIRYDLNVDLETFCQEQR